MKNLHLSFSVNYYPVIKSSIIKSTNALHIDNRELEEPTATEEKLAEESHQEEELGAGVFSEEGDSEWDDFVDQLGHGF